MGPAPGDTPLELEPAEVVALIEGDPGVQLIDVREQYERDAGHIADTRHVPLVELTQQAETVARDHPVVFYCRVGSRSTMAAQALRAAGYEAYSMDGGLVRWAAEQRPLEPEGGHVAQH
jgi:hydroxyacylglutathione hydrolase/adenylyltransferase/sulfurtransferase